MLYNFILLQDAPAGANFSGLLMIVLMIAVFYFFMVRPQQKKQKEIRKFREALTNGDKIITAGGIHGEIVTVKDTYFIVEVAPSVKIRVDKGSVYPSNEPVSTDQQPLSR
ncbi:MAG: preprotein translocase subunit YajC [Muribaculum sp.]|nr:preprotein translocase subunit YajC [Muribaculaceae bacterium]MCM1080545.1 preprotein translocase subunit YajC [Muribaculum sp.]